MPPGWYPDPQRAGMLRWWDGSAWTPFEAPAAATVPVAMYVPVVPDPHRDLATELKFGRYARIALPIGAAMYILYFVTVALVGHHILHQFGDFFDQLRADPNSQPPPPRLAGAAVLGLDGFGLLIALVQVSVIVWLYNAATFASRSGILARRTPLWAVLGFVIPVVNLWFPAQSAADLFEPGDPHRRLTGWWWAASLASGFVAVPIVIASWSSTSAALMIAVVASVVPAAAALTGRALIAASTAAHQARLAPTTGAASPAA